MNTPSQAGTIATPIAIVIAGVFIAGAVLFTSGNSATTAHAPQDAGHGMEQEDTTGDINPITEADHIRGNPDAPVKIVEYSDFACPFCQQFHGTLQNIMETYGADGQVAWVYRHFPLDQLHPRNARAAAVASECVAAQGGNDAFWQFTDTYFERTPSNDRADASLISEIAAETGINMEQFEACRTSGEFDQNVQEDIDNAVATGGRGTPWSVVVGPNGKTFPLSGAQPAAAVQQVIELALNEQ